MPSISDYVPRFIEEEKSHTKKRLTDKERKFLRKRAKEARKITRKNRK